VKREGRSEEAGGNRQTVDTVCLYSLALLCKNAACLYLMHMCVCVCLYLYACVYIDTNVHECYMHMVASSQLHTQTLSQSTHTHTQTHTHSLTHTHTHTRFCPDTRCSLALVLFHVLVARRQGITTIGYILYSS
jgi:hypothetical protein